MSKDEFFSGLRVVIPIALAMVAFAFCLVTIMLLFIGFQNARMHYTLATIFPLILTTATAFPLVVMSQRVRAAKDELEKLLRIDDLTKLPNRRAFFERTDEAFARGGAVSLMMMDVDCFKTVNDRYGHDVGDRVLQHVAQTIQSVVRVTSYDGAIFAARIGGEEFAVVTEGFDAERACAIADRLLGTMRETPARVSGLTIPVTLSIGIAHRRPDETPDKVLRAADNACYRAKRLGRDQCCAADAVADREPAAAAPAVPARNRLRPSGMAAAAAGLTDL